MQIEEKFIDNQNADENFPNIPTHNCDEFDDALKKDSIDVFIGHRNVDKPNKHENRRISRIGRNDMKYPCPKRK